MAHTALVEALGVSPGLPIALQSLARLSLAQGNATDAAGYAQELVQKFTADHSYRQLLAEALVRQGRIRQAEEQCRIAEQPESFGTQGVSTIDIASRKGEKL